MSEKKKSLVIYTDETGALNRPCIKEEQENEEPLVLLTPNEALICSMSEYGKPNLPYLEKVTGLSRKELIHVLSLYQNPAAYDLNQDPDTGWMTEDVYIKNKHIPKLYREAKLMHDRYGIFERNLVLLKKLYPRACGITARDLPIGNRIIPLSIYRELFRRMLSLMQAPDVDYNEVTMRYTILFPEKPSFIINYYVFGVTEKPATDVLRDMMNGEEQMIPKRVEDPFTGKVKSVRDEQKTLELLEKVKSFVACYYEILTEMMDEPDIYEMIADCYCKTLGGYRPGLVKADWVSPPGLKFHPFDHQRAGIFQITTQKTTLLAWDTGAGKSLTMIAGAQELKRLKISEKILFVIPNSSFTNFIVEAEKYYPEAHYLVINPTSFSAKKEYYLDLIKHKSYDAIMMASSSYAMLDMSKDYYLNQCISEIRKCKGAILTASHGEDQRILKNRLKYLEKKHTDLLAMVPKCTNCFEELGIDALFIDEAHNFKNVSLDSGFSYISGVNINGSAKCNRNMEKVHWILRQNGEKEGRVVFSTATPLKNSIAEQYIYQKYLQQDELKYMGMNSFKEWMKNYTEAYTRPFIDQDIQHLKLRTKLKFKNLTDLHAMCSSFEKFHHIERGTMNLPMCDGYRDVLVPAIREEEEAYRQIGEKLQDMKDGVVGRNKYNALMATIEGRNISSDIRLEYPDVIPPRGTTKEEYCAKEVKRFYDAYPGKTQAVFCDLSVPKDGFNIYDELKKEMIRLGIPAEEIAFIHDAEKPALKKKLLHDFNEGNVRVLIGSTEKMGTGLNIQKNLIACHHYDCPWSPAQLQQRNGRIIRLGNTNETVFILRYLKEKSYDVILWEHVQTKMAFIQDFHSYTFPEDQRDTEDITDNELSYGEAVAIALGNEKLKEHKELENSIKSAQIACRKRAAELQELQRMIAEIPTEIDRLDLQIESLQKNIAYYREQKKVISREQRETFGTTLLEAIARAKNQNIGSAYMYQGFKVIVPLYSADEKPYVRLKGVGSHTYKLAMEADTAQGCCMSLDHCLGTSMPKMKKRYEEKCEELIRELNHSNQELLKGNQYLKEVNDLSEQLEQLEKEMEIAS